MRLDPHAPGSLEAIEAQEAEEIRAEEARVAAARLKQEAEAAEATMQKVVLCSSASGLEPTESAWIPIGSQ